MPQAENIYHSYLVRLWLENRDDQEKPHWHIEIVSIQTGQKHQLPDLEGLFEFLRSKIAVPPA